MTDDRLSDLHYVTVIVRLTLGPDGRLVRGELLDVDGTTRQRFVDWLSLAPAIQAHLRSREDGR